MKQIKLLAALAFLAPLSASAESYRGLAKDLSRAARAAGLERVAVLPLSAVGGGEDLEGRLQAERLITQLARLGRVQVVERAQMRRVMEEHALGQTGALDGGKLARIGRLLQAQAVLTGTFAALGDKVELNVRLVDVESGVILTAAQARFERQAPAAALALFAAPAFLSADQAVADVLAEQRGETVAEAVAEPAAFELEDSFAKGDCRDAAGRVDALEASILELKARHWANIARMPGFSAAALSRRPAAVISAPALRGKFFDLLKKYAARPGPAMTMSEVQRFVSIDGRAFELHSRCGV